VEPLREYIQCHLDPVTDFLSGQGELTSGHFRPIVSSRLLASVIVDPATLDLKMLANES
jgi:hypothetical protein